MVLVMWLFLFNWNTSFHCEVIFLYRNFITRLLARLEFLLRLWGLIYYRFAKYLLHRARCGAVRAFWASPSGSAPSRAPTRTSGTFWRSCRPVRRRARVWGPTPTTSSAPTLCCTSPRTSSRWSRLTRGGRSSCTSTTRRPTTAERWAPLKESLVSWEKLGFDAWKKLFREPFLETKRTF